VSSATDAYAELLARARADPAFVGVVVFGSRAVGEQLTDASDVDCFVIVDAPREAARRWQTAHGSAVEVWAMPLDAFRSHAEHGTETWWNRPSFIRARVDLDRLDGEIAAIVEAKRQLTAQEAASVAAHSLDDAINSIFRALKTAESGSRLASRLDGLESIPPLLTAAFALEARVRPWNKWLEHELTQAPLRSAALTGVLGVVQDLSGEPTPERLRAAFRMLEIAAREAGHGEIVDGWEPDVAWLRGEVPQRTVPR
jgi:predicted nucleotidyltransferase